MKKKVFLILLLLFGCLFTTKNVYADTVSCKYPSNFSEITGINLVEILPDSSSLKEVKVGDKVYVIIGSKPGINVAANYILTLRTTDSDSTHSKTIALHLENFSYTGQKPGSEIMYKSYFVVTSDFKVGEEYKFQSLSVQVEDKNNAYNSEGKPITENYNCAMYVFKEEDLEPAQELNPVLLNSTLNNLKVVGEETIKKDGPDLLNSFTLKSETNKFYIGDKISFNVDLKDTIDTIAISLTKLNPNGTSSMISVHLTQEGNQTGLSRTYSGYLPKTVQGYYATEENGRTEMTIKPGIYSVDTIFLYKGGKYIRYTRNKSYSDVGEFLYYDSKISIDLNEPKADELNDVNFVLNNLKLKGGNNAAIGSHVPLSLDYTYDDTNKKVQSMYLVFKNANKAKTFTTYIKGLPNNPTFVIPSSADTATYKLETVGVTFLANDGNNNTIMIDDKTGNGKYSEFFNLELVIDATGGNKVDGKMYFSTEELSTEIYKTIQLSTDDKVTIEADNETVIPRELFEVIKDTDKDLVIKNKENELIFKGKEIDSPKEVDVLTNLYNVKESNISDNLKGVLNGAAVVVEFPNNGDLPGNALFRIKENDLISNLNTKKYYIYYANTENDTLDKVALDVQKTSDGYIEFYINHHSKYVIATQEIKNEEVLGEDDEVLENNEKLVSNNNNKTTVVEERKDPNKPLVLILAIVVVVLVIVVIILAASRNKKKAKVEDKPIVSEPLEEETTPEEEKVEEKKEE